MIITPKTDVSKIDDCAQQIIQKKNVYSDGYLTYVGELEDVSMQWLHDGIHDNGLQIVKNRRVYMMHDNKRTYVGWLLNLPSWVEEYAECDVISELSSFRDVELVGLGKHGNPSYLIG